MASFVSNGGNGNGHPSPRPLAPGEGQGKRAHLAVGAVLAGLGVLSLAEAFRIHDEWPGARLLPAVVGLALVLLGAAHLTGRAPAPPEWPDAGGRRRILFVSIVLAFYVLGLPTLGFLAATALFLVVVLRGLGGFSWLTAGVAAGAIALASHLVFRRGLALPLPSGLLGL
jgi:putative tricarboxylic transport membrane protein